MDASELTSRVGVDSFAAVSSGHASASLHGHARRRVVRGLREHAVPSQKKTSLEDDGVDDSSKEITTYYSKHHNGADHVQRSGGALAATHGQSVVLAQLEAQFQGEDADEGDQVGGGAVSRGHCEDPFRRCKCILALCDWLTRRPCQQHACRRRPRRKIGGERDSSTFSKAARAAARDGRKRAHLSRRGRLVCCCVERTREVADLVEPTKIVEAVRKKKTSLEDDGVDDSSKEITTYYSKHHNGADHVQRSGGALAATHGQSVVLAQLEAQFQGEDADEGDQVGGGAVSRGHCEDPFRRCKCILALCDWLTRRPCQQHACRRRPRRKIGGERDSSTFSKAARAAARDGRKRAHLSRRGRLVCCCVERTREVADLVEPTKIVEAVRKKKTSLEDDGVDDSSKEITTYYSKHHNGADHVQRSGGALAATHGQSVVLAQLEAQFQGEDADEGDQAARAAARDGRKRAHLSRRGRLVCCCVERTREVADLVEPTKIVEAVRKKKTSLEDDGVDDSSKEITTYYSKHHNGADHVQRSGGALAATHGQSVVLAQLEAQFQGEDADEGDQVGGGAVSRGHCEDPFRRCKCILALCDWLTRRPCQQHACRRRPRRKIGGERDSSTFSKAARAAARDGRKRAHLSRRGRLVCCCVERTREVADLVEPTKIVEAVRKKKTSLEDDGVDDSSKEITTYYSKHHNGADHVQRSGGALAATHGQSVVLAQLEAQFQGEDADEGDQVGGGAVSRGHCEDPFRRCKCILALCDWLTRRPCQQHACRRRPRRKIGGERDSSTFSKAARAAARDGRKRAHLSRRGRLVCCCVERTREVADLVEPTKIVEAVRKKKTSLEDDGVDDSSKEITTYYSKHHNGADHVQRSGGALAATHGQSVVLAQLEAQFQGEDADEGDQVGGGAVSRGHCEDPFRRCKCILALCDWLTRRPCQQHACRRRPRRKIGGERDSSTFSKAARAAARDGRKRAHLSRRGRLVCCCVERTREVADLVEPTKIVEAVRKKKTSLEDDGVDDSSKEITTYYSKHHNGADHVQRSGGALAATHGQSVVLAQLEAQFQGEDADEGDQVGGGAVSRGHCEDPFRRCKCILALCDWLTRRPCQQHACRRRPRRKIGGERDSSTFSKAARAAARDGRKRAHLSRRGRLVCCCVERTREVADLVEPTKIVEAVRKKKTSLEDDGVDDSSKEITTYYSKHHNGADHVQRSGGALAATHGQSVVLAQLEAQFQGEDADEGDQVGGGAVSRGHCEDPFRRCKCILALCDWLTRRPCQQHACRRRPRRKIGGERDSSTFSKAARAAARDGRKRAHLSRRGRLVCCCVERTREVADLVEPTKIVEAVRKKKTSLEDDGVDDSSKEITTYYSKHHNGADHVQRSGGALAATHGQSVVLAQLEAQFQGEDADEGDQVGGGAVSRGHCEDPFRRCKCILALCDWLTRRPCQQHACRRRPRRKIGGERDSSTFSKAARAAARDGRKRAHLSRRGRLVCCCVERTREVADLVEPTKIVEAVRKKKTSLEDDGVDDSSKEITTYYSKHHNGADHVQRSGGALAATHGQSVVLAQLEAQFQGEDADEGDQVGGGPPSGTSTAPALARLLW
ncbi:hypothetical protein Pcac1_g15006 [Phytophthora cactorum]|nr:hypothetical protein Pcac1_g15006 [Phytophthora cactorum]